MKIGATLGDWRHAALVTALLLAPGGFQPAVADEGQALHDALVAWFECIECDRYELREVAKYGDKAVPTLIAALRQGPSQATLQIVEQRAQIRHAQLVALRRKAASPEPVEPETEFVNRIRAAYSDRYRVRAVTALGEIGGQEALRSLCGLSSGEPKVVHEAVQRTLRKSDRKCL